MMLVAAWSAPIASAMGALAPSFPVLVATQTIGRPLGIALDVIIAVVAVEEMPRGARAYAISVLAMASGLGAGVAVLALPLADVSTYGWRLVYVLALVWLVVALDLTRRLPETQRFQRFQQRDLLVERPRIDRTRFAMLASVMVLTNLFVASASIFQNRFLRDELGYSATAIAVFTLVTATPAALGLLVGGRLADRRGRRALAAVGMPIGALILAAAFALSGAALWFVVFVGGLISAIAFPALAVYRRELFPTGSRGRVNGVLVAVALVGGSVGLVVTGWLLERGWSYAQVMGSLAVASILAGVIIAVGYPETSRRELEDINPEDRLADPLA
jgi:MFS family permease